MIRRVKKRSVMSRISLAPLSFEHALDGLLKVPPPKKRAAKKGAKKKGRDGK